MLFRHFNKLALFTLAFGMAMQIVSFFLPDIGLFLYTPDGAATSLQRGYAAAPNWPLTYVALVPIALYKFHEFRQLTLASVSKLAETGLIYNNEEQAFTPQAFEEGWRRCDKKASRIAFLLLVLALVASLGEFWGVTGHPLLCHLRGGSCPPMDHEVDWSTSAFFGGASSPKVTAVFSFLAYSFQQPIAILVVACTTLYGAWFAHYIKQYEILFDRRILPDMSKETVDARCGFQIFESLLVRYAVLAIICYVCMYLSTIQNFYLQQTRYGDVISYFWSLYDPTGGMKAIMPFVATFSTVWLGVGGVLLMVAAVTFFRAEANAVHSSGFGFIREKAAEPEFRAAYLAVAGEGAGVGLDRLAVAGATVPELFQHRWLGPKMFGAAILIGTASLFVPQLFAIIVVGSIIRLVLPYMKR